jgi:hypothetical protein
MFDFIEKCVNPLPCDSDADALQGTHANLLSLDNQAIFAWRPREMNDNQEKCQLRV